jgi:hypothetical protein
MSRKDIVMARPVEFAGFDHIEDTDPRRPDVWPLPVKRFPKSNLSCWKLDPDELEEIKRTGVIWLVSDTFGEMKPPPEGERWQPKLRLTGKETENQGW